MAKANLRVKEINKILSKASAADGDDSDSDDDLEDLDGLRSELKALQNANKDNQAKLDHYEKNKKWNVDNMCHVTEERTIVNKKVSENKFSETGFALPKEEDVVVDADEAEAAIVGQEAFHQLGSEGEVLEVQSPDELDGVSTSTAKMSAATIDDGLKKATASSKPSPAPADAKSKAMKLPLLQPQPNDPTNSVSVSFLSYHQFTQKYADVVEQFMAIQSMDRSKEFLLQHGDVLLQENASNYLLLASLEDEMNGYHEKMKLVARQSQIISNIAELAKSLKLHPGNVIHPFFQRMENKELFEGFMVGVNEFVQRIEVRAVQKRKEIDEERAREMKEQVEAVDVSEIPKEKRLGPGGLDPLEVFESLPESMQEAFESREKEKLEAALRAMTPEEVEYHMKRCVDSGLWNA
jgi:cell division cycle protein 37